MHGLWRSSLAGKERQEPRQPRQQRLDGFRHHLGALQRRVQHEEQRTTLPRRHAGHAAGRALALTQLAEIRQGGPAAEAVAAQPERLDVAMSLAL